MTCFIPFLNSCSVSPAARPNLGNLEGPNINKATINMMATSPNPRSH